MFASALCDHIFVLPSKISSPVVRLFNSLAGYVSVVKGPSSFLRKVHFSWSVAMWNGKILLCACLGCKHAAPKQKDSRHHINNKKNAVSVLVIWSRWTDHEQKHSLTKIKSKCCENCELHNVGNSWILQFCESFYLFVENTITLSPEIYVFSCLFLLLLDFLWLWYLNLWKST